MFTLKFFTNLPGSATAVSCPRYSVHPNELATGVTVRAFPTMGPSGDVEFGVGTGHSSQDDFDHCYVENSAGKTIDRIGPFNPEPPHR